MKLAIEQFTWNDLHDTERLADLSGAFDRFIERHDALLFARFDAYRGAVTNGIARGGLDEPQESALLIDVSRCLGGFLAQLFGTDETPLKERASRDAQVARFKKEVVAKRVAKVQKIEEARDEIALPLIRVLAGANDSDLEYQLAVAANRLLDLEREYPRAAKSHAPSAETRAALALPDLKLSPAASCRRLSQPCA